MAPQSVRLNIAQFGRWLNFQGYFGSFFEELRRVSEGCCLASYCYGSLFRGCNCARVGPVTSTECFLSQGSKNGPPGRNVMTAESPTGPAPVATAISSGSTCPHCAPISNPAGMMSGIRIGHPDRTWQTESFAKGTPYSLTDNHRGRSTSLHLFEENATTGVRSPATGVAAPRCRASMNP